ncbi:hypothetical protein B0H13DRAFT_2340664 [Mycena leptocephala]|nr:hypothetical protein B0H13DRAFT_2340664 [Mycena leptocephala]
MPGHQHTIPAIVRSGRPLLLPLAFMHPPSTDSEVSNVYMALKAVTPKFPAFAYGFLYATLASSRRVVPVPYNYGVAKIESADDLFINAWIPYMSSTFHIVDRSVGCIHVTHFPGTKIPLEFCYTIFYVPRAARESRVVNQCLSLRANKRWFENVLVVKHGKRKAIINMDREDTFLVDNIVSINFYPCEIVLSTALGNQRRKRLLDVAISTFGRAISLSCPGVRSHAFTPLLVARPHLRVLLTAAIMPSNNRKKRPADKQSPRKKGGKRMRTRLSSYSVAGETFFHIPEMLLMELFYHCDLITLFTLAKTGQYARDLVKAFFATNLRLLVSLFMTDEHVDQFYDILEASLSAVGGSTVSSVLSFPYRHRWLPSNLNILLPFGRMFEWRDFLERIGLHEIVSKVKGVDRKHARTTASHIVFESFIPGHTILLSESKDESVLTLLMSATTTWCTNIATCSDIYSLYTKLTVQNRALEGWFPTNVRQAVAIGKRNIRSSISTSSWNVPCGWQCPVLWRDLRGFKGVGVFRWGGNHNQHKDGLSTVGNPVVKSSMKWRLGDLCTNRHCPFNNASYSAVTSDY